MTAKKPAAKKTAPKRLTATQIKRIHELSAKGQSQRQIAKAVKCSRSAVWAHLQK